MGNTIQITTNQSDPPMTKTHKNNTYNLRKDSNNSNSDSKYDRLSLKRLVNSYSEEETLNFGEHSSDSGTLSSATKNNIIEGNVLPTISSTTNRGKANI